MAENIDRVKDNLQKMIEAGAPESDLNQYLKSEGFSQDSFVKAMDLTRKAGGKQSEYGMGRALAQGATFGFADEIEAALSGGDYGQNMASLELAKKEYERQNPKTAMAAEIVGGLPYAAVPFLGAAKYAQMASKASPLTKAAMVTVPSVAAGAATGALTGAGQAEPGARMAAAKTGAKIGGAVSAALPVVGKTLGSVGGKVVDVTAGIPVVQRVGQGVGLATGQTVNYANRAKEKLLEAIYRDAANIPSMKRAIASTDKPVGIVDVAGENVKSLGDIAQKYPGTTREIGRTALEERGIGQSDRIQKDISDYLGDFSDPFEFTQQIAARQRENAGPLYQLAYEAGEITEPNVLKYLELPQFKQAAKESEKLLAAEGRTIDLSRPTVEALDNIKQGLDALIEKETDSFGKVYKLGKVYVAKKNEFLSELDKAVPAYKEARKSFAGDAELIDATRMGQKATNMSSAQIKREFNALSPSQQEAYRIGALDSLRSRMDKAKDSADLVKRIFGSKEDRAKIEAFFPDQKSFKAFEAKMKSEANMRNTQEKVLRGSQTFERTIGGQGLEADPTFLSQILEQGVGRGSLNYLRAQGQGVAGQTAEELGPMLFKLGQKRDNIRTLRDLEEYQKSLLDFQAKKAAGTTGLSTIASGLLAPE